MATSFPTYPATTFEQAVELAIFSSNQLHNIINADALSTVETEEGNIPSVRKAIIDNLYFKTPSITWEEGTSVTVFNQLYTFSGGSTGTGLWYSPTATTSNPVVMGESPEGDANWRLYGWDTYSKTDLNSTSGASYIGTGDGKTVQDKLDNAVSSVGAYEEGPLTIYSHNDVITYNGGIWYVKPGVTVPFTTSGESSTSWNKDSVNFVSVASELWNPQMQVPTGTDLTTLGCGQFDVPDSERWGLSGIKFGGENAKTTLTVGEEGLKLSLENGGNQVSSGIMFPTVRTMKGMQGANGLNYKLVEFPSDGYEDPRQGMTLMQAYRPDGAPAWYLTPPLSNAGFNDPIPTSGNQGYKLVTGDEVDVSRPVYGYTDSSMATVSSEIIKLCSIDISSGTTLPTETGEFLIKGAWDRQRVSEEVLITMNNLQFVNVSDVPSMTAAQWSDHFRVFTRGQTYFGASASRVRVYLEVSTSSIELYASIPSTFYGVVSERCFRGNPQVTTYINSMQYTGDFTITENIEIYRHLVIDTLNSAACSDGVRISSDSHLRIVSYTETDSPSREITNDNFYWAGYGTTNAYHSEGLTIERISTGVYTVNGVTGFWNGSIRLRQPYDENGEQTAIAEVDGYSNRINVYAISYTLDTSTNSITRGKGALMDIPTNSWVDAFYYANWS